MKKFPYHIPRLIFCLLLAAVCLLIYHHTSDRSRDAIEVTSESGDKYIKWVDFNVTYEALCTAYDLDVASYDSPVHLNWIELLAYAGAKCGGNFDKQSIFLIGKLAGDLSEKKTTIREVTKDL